VDKIPASERVEALVQQYYKLVFHTIYGLTNNWEESQDLTQDTFHQALKGIDAAETESGANFHAKAWLLRIALNTVRMSRRRKALFSFIPFSNMFERKALDTAPLSDREADTLQQQAAPVQPGGYSATNTGDPADTIAEQDAVQRTMAQLPEAARACLLLSIVAGLSIAEIADMLELKEPAVRQRLARARKQFQQLYLQESGEALLDTSDVPEPRQDSPSPARSSGAASAESSVLTNKHQHMSRMPHPSEVWSSYA
jgi:RNA polymerase sigma-70 factor (ECF subfamily)